MEGIFFVQIKIDKILLMPKRPDFTPEQAGYNSKQFTTQPLNLGRGKEMVCRNGVWTLKGEDKPQPLRLDVLVAKKRDREWRRQYE